MKILFNYYFLPSTVFPAANIHLNFFLTYPSLSIQSMSSVILFWSSAHEVYQIASHFLLLWPSVLQPSVLSHSCCLELPSPSPWEFPSSPSCVKTHFLDSMSSSLLAYFILVEHHTSSSFLRNVLKLFMFLKEP